MHSEHFSEAELACRGKTCGRNKTGCHVNGVRQELLDVLEAFRFIAGPTIVNDAFRCAIHNAQVGGAPNSEHVQGIAADIRVAGMSAAQLEAIARQIPAIKGIGRDDFRNYIHIDTRPLEAQWCYPENGVGTIAYYVARPATPSGGGIDA